MARVHNENRAGQKKAKSRPFWVKEPRHSENGFRQKKVYLDRSTLQQNKNNLPRALDFFSKTLGSGHSENV